MGRVQIRPHFSLHEFYSARGYASAWVNDLGTVPLAEVLLDALRGASIEGLCPEDYHLDLITSLLKLAADSRGHDLLFDPYWMAQLDLLLTDAFLWYASDHLQGRMAFAELRQQSRWENIANPAKLLPPPAHPITTSGIFSPMISSCFFASNPIMVWWRRT